MRLLNGNVLVQDIKETQTKSGIYIPDSATNKSFTRSKVIAFDQNIEVLSEGMTVKVMASHDGYSYDQDGQEVRIINVGAILEIED